MFSGSRQQHRRIFIDAWRKAANAEPLEPLEAQIVEIVKRHPEYQPVLGAGEEVLDRDFASAQGASNPFFHMGLHLAVIEQLSIDQPPGIRALYRSLIAQGGDAHDLDHRIMECLAQLLVRAQQGSGAFDAQGYLECIERGARA